MSASRPESSYMKTNIAKIGAVLLVVGICICSTEVRAQITATVTTTNGAFTEFVPGSQTVVVRTEANPAPLRYVVTKETTIVDESGAPVTIERISPGSPLAIQYTGTGEHLVASRIVVQRTTAVTGPVTTAPVTTEQQTTTTTTTTRDLTHDEKEALKERAEHRKERVKEQTEKQKKALEKAKDKLDDDDDDGD
jgi:hypothetical protein